MPLTPFATDFTSVGPRLMHYRTGQRCVVVQNPLNPRREVGGGESKVSAIAHVSEFLASWCQAAGC